MSFTQFVKPYPDGYEDFESGGTPVTAEILNTNYDGFLLALNEFLPGLEGMVEANPSESATAGNLTKLKVGNSIYLVPSGGGSGSSVSFEQILSSGTKIGIITIDGNSVDVYAPTPSGGASAYSDLTDVIVSNPSAGQVPIYNDVSSKWENGTLPVGDDVSFTQVVSTGTKLGTITINNVDYDIYAPTQTNPALSDLTDTDISSPTDGQVIKYNSLTEKWENGDASGGTGGHTIIDENGNSMTARAGLQFVGGANVSDDPTNNKTIVDLASAGGIDGVFINTDNVIYSTSSNATDEYTATEDCFVMADVVTASNQVATVKIDGVLVCEYFYSNVGTGIESYNGYLKKGQTIKVEHGQPQTHTFKVLGIQTGTTHSKFQPVIYSTEEREIGVWKDGKPLYVKTYNVTFSSNYTDVTIDTTHEVKLLDGGVDSNANDNFIHLGYGTSQNDMCGAYEYEAGKIRFQNFYYSSRPNGWLNVYYTKSTDVAGSGSWTPQGVPAVHYSTDEHIIGTWIDGSTLYEKTIQTTSPSSNVDTSIADLTSLNIDVLVDLKGFIKSTNVNQFVPINWFYNDSGANLDNAMYYDTSSKNLYQLVTGSNYQDSTEYITIQYTKSS